ncbi:hypothetical protein AMECASPLE_038885 [Ameca splendens]|uniref:Uncharacterized protein n=1 Tax=Ameca splendens TaxID=208324 RepID=A0ABV0Z760_9TELE
MVDYNNRVAHFRLPLLCVHTCTSEVPCGLIKVVGSLPLFGNVTSATGTDTSIIGLNTPTVSWEWLGLGMCVCVCVCVWCFDPVNVAQLAGDWLMPHWINECCW